MARLVSGRVKKTPQSGITSDRYQFLGLEQAEPDLGDPIIGPSAYSGNPVPPGDQYLLINVGGQTGRRYWMPSTNLAVGGLSPGSFTIFNNGIQVGLANSFNKFNFVGTGVTVDYVGPNLADQTGIATVRITVIDLVGPGNPYEIPYKNPSTGLLSGATGVVYRNNNVGIGSTIPTQKLDVLGDVNVSGQIGVNTVVAGFLTASSAYVAIGTISALYVDNFNVGTDSTVIKTYNGNVGIGSTLPQYKLDVLGSSRFYGVIYDYLGNTGSFGNALLSNGPGTPPTWGVVGQDAPVGIAVSVSTKEATNNQLYYIGFSSTTNSYSSLYVDSNGLYYNPSSVQLGIGTQPSYSLDVSGTIRADQIIVQNLAEAPGIVTTTSTNTVVIDTFNTATYRSARYNLQVTTNNQLRLGAGSVSGLNTGVNYLPGTYNDVVLISSGIGTGAKATINVTSPAYPITASFGGIFTTSSSISGIPTGYSVILSNTLTPTAYEQSKLTEIQVTNSGAGFTTVPSITISSPIIVGNPVAGVGVGSTAVVRLTSMKVTNVVLNTTGIVTSTVPTVTYKNLVGVGTSATGYVGFGISTFTITNPGSGYTVSPTITYNQTPTSTPVTRVGMGISSLNLQITGGSGYNTGLTQITVNPVGGIGTGAVMQLGSVGAGGSITAIDIINVGSGYTVPPTVTITNTVSGVGAAVTIRTMVVTDVTVTSVGSGFGTSKPTIGFAGGGAGAAATVGNIVLTSIEVNNSGFGYTSADMPVTATVSTPGVGNTVGLGIYSVTATTGLGYTTNPSFTISSPTISPLTGAALTSVVGYGATHNLVSGPGYGGTGVYYINPINSNTFRLTRDLAGTNPVFLGYDLSSVPTAYIGGSVSSVNITNSGSGYQVGEVLRVDNNSLKNQYASTVGTGFSFSVAGPLIQSFQISDLMLLQSVGSASTDAYVIEYAGIANQDNLGDYSADVSGSSARLKFTPTYAHNTVKLTRKGTEL
jgi:hypothetical protein